MSTRISRDVCIRPSGDLDIQRPFNFALRRRILTAVPHIDLTIGMKSGTSVAICKSGIRQAFHHRIICTVASTVVIPGDRIPYELGNLALEVGQPDRPAAGRKAIC
jgi:hypothetical protein